jgi:hypothetical protein
MHRLYPIIFAVVVLAACKSDAEKLVDLRTDLRTTLEELYSAYRAPPAPPKDDPREPERTDVAHATASRLVGELERSYFEEYCLSRGRGERPFSLSAKLDAFMKEAANEKACRHAAKLEARIAELEARGSGS